VIEVFLDANGVARTSPKKNQPGETRYLRLDERLSEFYDRFPVGSETRTHYDDLLTAAQFVTNEGTHGLEDVKDVDLGRGAEWISRVLALTYPDNDELLHKARQTAALPPRRKKAPRAAS